MTVLVIAEHDHQHIKDASRQIVAAASKIDKNIHILVAGLNIAQVAVEAAKISGVSKVIQADGPSMAHLLAENMELQILEIAHHYSHILFSSNAWGKNIAPRVAARLDSAQISDITSVVSADTFQRPIYAGSVLATVQSLDAIKVITVRTTSFEAVSTEGNALIESIAAVPCSEKVSFVSRELAKNDRPDLTVARVVVSGGRGMGSAENFKILTPLADKMGAALGASRAAVDAGYAPNDLQIGQTGKIVAPQLYVAVGISGAIQHLAGMKDSKIIIAVNKDIEAPIFSVADYGLVSDLFEAIPELTSAL